MVKEVKQRSGIAVGLNAGHVRYYHLPTYPPSSPARTRLEEDLKKHEKKSREGRWTRDWADYTRMLHAEPIS